MNDTQQRGLTFARYASALVISRGDPVSAIAYAQSQSWNSSEGVALQLKALITPTGLADYGTRGPVFDDLANYLRSRTLQGRLALRRVPIDTRMIRGIGGTAAAWVREGSPLPVSKVSLEETGRLIPLRIGSIAVTTPELARARGALSESVLAADITRAQVELMDRSLIDPSFGEISGERPASVTHGATQINSSGITIAAVDIDLKAAMQAMIAAGVSLASAAWCLHPSTAANLALMRDAGGLAYPGLTANGGTLAGLPAFCSEALSASGSPGDRNIVLLAQDEIDYAEGGGDLSLSGNASLQMDDAPSTGAQQMVNLWESNLVGIRIARWLNWKARRPGAAVVIRNVLY
jgi:hypothetical protein